MPVIRIYRSEDIIRVTRRPRTITLKHVGPRGVAGPQGPVGPGGIDKTFEQDFISSSLVTVNHNLGKRPAVSVTDTANDVVEGEVHYVDLDTLTISFSTNFSGSVLCN